MEKESADIKAAIEKLRTDLMASNTALQALISVLSPEQQAQVLKAFAELTVMQERSAEKLGMPEAIAPLQAAHQRLYSGLQGAARLRASKLKPPPSDS